MTANPSLRDQESLQKASVRHRLAEKGVDRVLWLLVPGAVTLVRGRAPGAWFRWMLWAVAMLSLLGLVLHWLTLQAQVNLQWIVLLLPLHAALAWVLGRRDLPVTGR